jgi:copper resistance protein B
MPEQPREEGERGDEDLMDHEGMDHGTMDHGSTGQAGMDHQQMDHGQPAEGEMDHSDMDHNQMHHAMPAGRHAPRTPIPVLTDADRAAAFQDLADHATHDQRIVHMVQFNRFEATDGDHGSGFAWEGVAWIGNDWNRLWLRSEGERVSGDTEAADLEVLYGRPVARWWDAVVGLRHDFKPGDARTWAAVGVMGLAPQKFEIEATAYVGESGDLAGSFEAEYEFLLTNRLILQPLFEFTLYGDDDPLRGIGSGLGTAELGLRLRYEFDRQFAPYIGVVRERAFGNTADLRHEEGESIDDTLLVAGIRFWF